MKPLGKWFLASAALLALITFGISRQSDPGKNLVSSSVVPSGQILKPAGKFQLLKTRPLDLVVTRDGKTAFVKHIRGVMVIDTQSLEVLQDRPLKGGGSMTGIALSPDEKQLAVSNAASDVSVFNVANRKLNEEIVWKLGNAKVGGASYPLGLLWTPKAVWVALSRDNTVAELDPISGTIRRKFPIGVSPFAVASDGKSIFVSAWAPFPKNEETALSAGSRVAVDKRGIGKGGIVARIELATNKVLTRPVGLQPTSLLTTPGALWVAVSNDDRVLTFDSAGFRPVASAEVGLGAFGAMPNGLAVLPDRRIAVGLSGKNSVGILAGGQIVNEIPTHWYPLALATVGKDILVISSKGEGSRAGTPPKRGVYDFTGAIARVNPARDGISPTLVAKNAKPRPDAKPVPIPVRVGEPSVFEHVVYIIKENRTYDQVFGDLPQGNGDPSLCLFPREVTPNHHAIAEQFVLLDNYYCNGVLSADGHAWTTEAIATTHFERSFGGWTRSYPFGDDPLSTSREGFLWDRVLDAGKTFTNYGEFDYAAADLNHAQILDHVLNGAKAPTYKHNIGVRRVREHSVSAYPGWGMGIPDIARADIFVKDFAKKGTLSNLTIVYLPQDHTSGGTPGSPSPRAHLADNDLALGRVIEAISMSKQWPKTCIFVIEDDPQDGVDHVDGHRSPCLVVSPYTKRGAVVSSFYNQTSVIRTIRHILGLKPMTRFDTLSPLMSACFTTTADLTPYTALPAQVPLTEVNPPSKRLVRHNLSKPDMLDEETFNRDIWTTVRPGQRYPVELSGPLEERSRKPHAF